MLMSAAPRPFGSIFVGDGTLTPMRSVQRVAGRMRTSACGSVLHQWA
jgi:hypothetical protein